MVVDLGGPGRWLARFGPPFAWMGVIAVLSGDRFAAEATGSWLLPVLTRLAPWVEPPLVQAVHAALRKLWHVGEYGVLGLLWLRALASGRPSLTAAGWAIGLATLYAGVDEARQALAPGRSPSLVDVALDAVGAFLAVALWDGRGAFARVLRRLASWGAAALVVGSLTAAAIDWTLGLVAWDLVLAAGGALVVAWVLRPRGPYAQ